MAKKKHKKRNKKINSRAKGQKGELEVRNLFRHFGFDARRGQQFCGGPNSPDVQQELNWIHVEVKLTETFNAYKAMEQAENDSGLDKIPVVFHRRNRKEWLAVLNAKNFLGILRRFQDRKEDLDEWIVKLASMVMAEKDEKRRKLIESKRLKGGVDRNINP